MKPDGRGWNRKDIGGYYSIAVRDRRKYGKVVQKSCTGREGLWEFSPLS